jgi:hypothetical protein
MKMFRKEKKCKNTECEAIIQYFENPKKIFCNSTCKSRYHYLKDTVENAEIISIKNALRTNYKIIVYFIANGIFVINAEVAESFGFKRRIYMDLLRRFPGEKNSFSLKRIKEVYFVFDLLNNRIVLYDNNSIKDVA